MEKLKTPAVKDTSKKRDQIQNKRKNRTAMSLKLGQMLGKAFRYVTVNKDGKCEEIDEQFVQARREALLCGSLESFQMKKQPLKKLRKARKQQSHTPTQFTIGSSTAEGYARPNWLPESFKLTGHTNANLSGWVNTDEELEKVLKNHSSAFSCKFVSWYKGRSLHNTFDPKRISWKREDIEPGCPFAIDSYIVRHCPHGMKLSGVEENQDNLMETAQSQDEKGWTACRARLKIRRVTLYDSFKISREEKTKKAMWERMLCLKKLLSQDQNVQSSSRIYVQLPLPAAHRNHCVSEFGGQDGNRFETLNSLVGNKIEDNFMKTLFDSEEASSAADGTKPKMEINLLDANDQSLNDSFQVLPISTVESVDDQWTHDQETNTVNNFGVPEFAQHEKSDTETQIKESGQVQLPYKRSHILSSCKVHCPARIKVKRVTLYESFKLEPGDSRRRKDDKMLLVKEMISNGLSDDKATMAIFMQLPLAAAHRNHQITTPLGVIRTETVTTSEGWVASHQFNSQKQGVSNLPEKAHFSWLPHSFNLTTWDREYITGWVKTEKEYLDVLESHRLAFNCSFLLWSNDKERMYKREAERRVMWKKDFIDPGCPLTVHHSLILSCAFSGQSKAVPQTVPENMMNVELSFLGSSSHLQDGILQVPQFMQDGTSLEIQYCDNAHHHTEQHSFVNPNETYIILMEN